MFYCCCPERDIRGPMYLGHGATLQHAGWSSSGRLSTTDSQPTQVTKTDRLLQVLAETSRKDRYGTVARIKNCLRQLATYRNQCCGAATFLGGSGSGNPRSRSRLRLRPNWVGSGYRQKKTVSGGSGSIHLHFSFWALKTCIINASLFWITFTGYHYKLLKSHVLSQQQGFLFMLAKKMQPEPPCGSGQQKNWFWLQLHLKSGGSGSATLIETSWRGKIP